ncbi:hypothetical protein Tco_1193593 [Tanacetum coccineum]
MQQFWHTIKKVKGTNSYEFYLANKKCVVDAEVFRKILNIFPRVQGEDFTEVPNDETTLSYLINLGYKGPLHKHPSMYVDYMHQPWITLAAIINKCLSGKTASNDRLRKLRIDILWGMFYKENGSSEGTGTKPGVPDESIVTPITLSEGTEKESEYTKEDDDDENIEWVDTDEEDEKNDNDDDKNDDEETDDDFVYGDEQVNDDEDKEMTNADDADTRNDPLPAISQRVYVLEKEVQELKEVDHTTTLRASLRSEIPSAVNAYLGTSLGDALQMALQKHTKELKQQYSQKVDYKEIIEESVQANVINEVKNQLPNFLPKAVSNFATPVIQSTVNKALEKTPVMLA